MDMDKNIIVSNNETASSNEKAAEELLASVKAKLYLFFDPNRYKAFLNAVSRFHRYSYVNIILITLSYPNASYVAGFKTWKKRSDDIWHDPKRMILKEDQRGKGISVFAPYTVVNETTRQLINYRVLLYDTTQMNDIPPLEQCPDYVIEPKIQNLLSSVRFHSPYRIVCAGKEDSLIQNGLFGYCNHDEKVIVVDEKLKSVKLLSEMMRCVIEANVHSFDYKRSEYMDLITESILFVLNKHFGSRLNNLISSDFSFIRRYKNKPICEIEEVLHLIQRISNKMITEIEDILQMINELDKEFYWFDPEEFIEDYGEFGGGI